MKIYLIIGILLISLVTGIIIRLLAKKKPKTEFVIWIILMTVWLGFLIYGFVLVINQETPLFTKNHFTNEFTVIASILFLISGYLYFRKKRNYFLERKNK